MTSPKTQFEDLARQAAVSIEAAAQAGEQLTFLPDEATAGEAGRPPRGKGRATNQMREWLAAKGFRLPEDVLAEMAGMASGADAFLTALQRTEQVLIWAQSGARDVVEVIKDGVLITKELDNRPTTGQRLATFQFVFTAQLRAVEALLPYGLAKVTPDVASLQVTQIVQMPSPAAPMMAVDRAVDRAAVARDVTPSARRVGPPPMPWEIQENQQVSEGASCHSDGEVRTE
jgi:hypothetical protein